VALLEELRHGIVASHIQPHLVDFDGFRIHVLMVTQAIEEVRPESFYEERAVIGEMGRAVFSELLPLVRQHPGAEQHRVSAIAAHHGHHSRALNRSTLRRVWVWGRDDHVLGADRESSLGANRTPVQAFGFEEL
jgi:hypothetical protein